MEGRRTPSDYALMLTLSGQAIEAAEALRHVVTDWYERPTGPDLPEINEATRGLALTTEAVAVAVDGLASQYTRLVESGLPALDVAAQAGAAADALHAATDRLRMLGALSNGLDIGLVDWADVDFSRSPQPPTMP